jgi:GTP1/Obg family GTP-binding protein
MQEESYNQGFKDGQAKAAQELKVARELNHLRGEEIGRLNNILDDLKQEIKALTNERNQIQRELEEQA